MKKLMIAAPCHHGKVDTEFTLSLMQSLYILDHAGIPTTVLLPTTGSLLAKERNDILEAFWQSDCSHLLCVDSDLGWQPDAPLKFLNYDVDVVAGVYPARRNSDKIPKYTFIPEFNGDQTLRQHDQKPLIGVQGVPAGFMMISRECVERMREFYPEKKYDGSNNFDSAYCFFNTELRDGSMWGEDYIFCKNAIEAGVEIWCDPMIQFNHAGIDGRLVEILTNTQTTTETQHDN